MFAKCIIFCVSFSLQYNLISTSDSCQKKITCQECISDPSICVWCAENDFNGTTRCMPQSSIIDGWCPKSQQNPKNEVHASEEKDFSSVSEQIIQIKPQRYDLKLRQGMPQSFNFSFQGAQDYPVDLYFLLDASRTMENIKNMTAEQGQKIYAAIKQMTKNVHLGFGTFIDKRMLPIMSNIDDPELTYSFRHRLKLADDFKQFKEEVSKSPSGVSRDVQEGGLDALAQVLVCEDIIGWRKESRKIVVFLTDGPYHAAGDGKSAGLFEPYDGQCYTENGTYTKELEMDYPSVGMINKLAAERDIIIIFLVQSSLASVYNELKKVVSGSHVAQFYRTKQNMKNDVIVTILKDIYENISKKIKLIAKVKSGSKKHLKISFNPDCTTDDNNPACDVENGKELHLVGTVQYNSADSAVVDIIVEGIREKLTLNIDAIKSCDCERHVEINSAFCYGDKRLCGICSCSENRYGDKCGCVKSENNGYKDNSTCLAAGSTDICGGHGSCICGTCQCRTRYKGKFCQCNIYSCPRSTWSSPESVCGGPEHGECDCGRCKCSADWSGDACDCYTPDTYCKEYNSSSVCNDRGQCVCGQCQCDQLAEWDARNSQTEKCQISPCTDCHERQCGKLKSCAKSLRTGDDDGMFCDDRMIVNIVDSLKEEHKNSSLWNLCSNVKVEIGCQTSFVYRYDDTNYKVELVVAKEKDCAPSYLLFGGIFLATLLLVGLGTLIAWKLLTDARDRHEYLKFTQQNQLDDSGPCSNPLYAPPTTTFNNPAFRKRSVDIR